MRSVIFEFGVCGFGWAGGLFPEIRLGAVRVWCCHGVLRAKLLEYERALAAAAMVLGG